MCKELKPVTPGDLSGAEARRRSGLSSFTLSHFVILSFFILFLAGCGTKTTDTTSAPSTPSAPTGLSVAAGNGQVMISWSSVSGATSYNIYWSTTTGVTKTTGTKITGATSPYTHAALTNGTTYYYIVTAVNSVGESVESAQVSATPAVPVSGVGTKFPIATTTADESSVSAAFDGTNYLVGIRDDASANVGAQLMDGSGNLIGSRISTGRTGGEPWIAFNGTNYLMAWYDDATYPNGVIYGEVISKTGTVVKAPFAISTTVGNLGKGIIVCVGGTCSVLWDDNTTKAVYGRDIDSTGNFVSNEYTIESGTATGNTGGDPFGACDANGNCMVVYDTGTNIRASIKGPTINKNTFTIAAKAPVTAGCTDHNPSPVAFDGTNYLVVWNDHSDCAPIPTWDILAQRVDVNGTLVGAPFQVNSSSTKYAAAPFMAFDGTNFLVTWFDGRNDADHDGACDAAEGTCLDAYGQYISKTGTLVGSEFVINTDAGNQFGIVTGFNAGKYLVIVNNDMPGDVYGVFVTP